MILKWIACSPAPGKEQEYLASQRIWNRESFGREHVLNYVMAEGGERVHILIEWPNQEAVDRFMGGTHKWLMQEHPLGEALSGYTVAYYDHVESIVMPPAFDRIRAGEAIVRLVRNRVPESIFDQFIQVLREVWNPSMAQAVGFMGGRVWRRRDDPTEVLMISYFRNAATERHYAEKIRPNLHVTGRDVYAQSKGLESLALKVTDLYTR